MSTTKQVFNPLSGQFDTVTKTVDAATDITGTLPVANGGTNSSTALANGKMIVSAAGKLVEVAADSSMSSNKITNLKDPTSAQDAATKAYVDNVAAGINPAVAVQAATTSAGNTSALTYNNGVAGVGATLTGANNTALTVDGFTFTTLGQRLLVKNDTQSPSGAFNGIYYVTQVQALALPLVLTRALDYDMPSDINNTGAIPVINGTVNGTTQWVLTSSVTTVGTDPLTFTEFARNPADYLLKASNLSDVASKTTSFDNLSPMTTAGDIIIGGASGTGTRLAAGTSTFVLTSNGPGVAPSYQVAAGGAPASALYQFATAQGYGSTNTAIPYYTSLTASSDSAGLLLVDNSSTLGLSVTALKACTVTMTFPMAYGAGEYKGISRNSNQLSTTFDSITQADKMAQTFSATNTVVDTTATIPLAPGDILRPHLATGQTLNGYIMIISASAVLPAAVTKGNAKYRYTTQAGFGSTNNKIPYYTTQAVASDGSSLLSIANSSTNGFSVTALKACMVTMVYNITYTSADYAGASINSNQLTTSIVSITDTDIVSLQWTNANNYSYTFTATVPLAVNDVLRPHTAGTTTNSNSLNNMWVAAVEL